MLSAVENFGPAAAAAPPPHVYAHHHPFAIAAAAAAAGSAAAAAAAVMPSQSQTTLDHYTIVHSPLLSGQQNLGNTGLYLPPSHLSALPPPSQNSPTTIRSPQLNSDSNASVVTAMSSAEFARPHPKQPRYSSSNNNNNNNNSSNNNNNNNSSLSNNNISSNGIPLHLRSTKIGGNCLGNNLSTSRTKYSVEQSGPVNLATNNNNNNSNNNNNNSNTNNHSDNLHNNSNSSVSSPPNLESINGGSSNTQQSSPTDTDVMAGIYAQKLPFTAPAVVTNAAAVAAAAYQFNYPHIYGRGAIYGTSALYPSHHPLNSRSQLHSRPMYIGGQHEPFSPYLSPSVTYSPPAVQAPPPSSLRPPPQQSQSISIGNPHSTANLLNNNHSSSNNSLCTSQLPIMPDRQHQTLHHVPPSNLITTDRLLPSSRDKEVSKNSHIYPNGKVNSSTASLAVSSFKVPCGKEGSLKHRILTRPPYGDRDSRRRSPITTSIVRSSSSNSAPTNFSKGSVIELSNGVLRRVEDMRTEDFIQSAEKSPYHQLADSTVVKIINTPSSVIITFSYDKNRSKADVEVSQEHPFFVYGQGWASCNPELSLQTFGLKCQRLQVGDVCISLIARETPSHSQSTIQPVSPQSSSVSSYSASQLYKEELSPQNLSRKSQNNVNSSTIPTTATGTAVTSRLSAPVPQHLAPPPSSISHLPVQSYNIHSYQTGNAPVSRHHSSPPSSLDNGLVHHIHGHRIAKHMGIPNGRFLIEKHTNDLQNSPPPPPPPAGIVASFSTPITRPSSNQPYYLGTSEISRINSTPTTNDGGSGTLSGSHDVERHHLTPEQQAAAAARKRRWSAPDNICDEEGCQSTASKTMNKS